VPLLAATHGRAVIDLNRAEDEIDPAMLEGPLPARLTDRVRRGYGLVPRLAGGVQPLYARRIPLADLARRIETLHRPWHRAIADGLMVAQARHGHAVLLDCHSMPSLDASTAGGRPPDLVLGDRHGASAAPALVDWLAQAFTAEGLRVALNRPYAGGHTTERHGRPAAGHHAVQIEIDRALYLDPVTLAPTARMAPLADLLRRIIGRLLAEWPLPGEAGLAVAAE
jgi:N-formylglutamate amidohydrolase